MSLNQLPRLLAEMPEFKRIISDINKNGDTNLKIQLMSEAIPFILAGLSLFDNKTIMVLVSKPEDARVLYDQLLIWIDKKTQLILFPETENMPFERIVPDVIVGQDRLRGLRAIADIGNTPTIVIASNTAISQKTINRNLFEHDFHRLTVGEEIILEEVIESWIRLGYVMETMTETVGSFSRRGGILDVFPVDSAYPCRIELMGNEIDSIRRFDPENQLSLDKVDSVQIFPAKETLPSMSEDHKFRNLMQNIDMSNCTDQVKQRFDEEINLLQRGSYIDNSDFYSGLFQDGSVFDYLPDKTIVIKVNSNELDRVQSDRDERICKIRRIKEDRGELPLHFPSSYFTGKDIENIVSKITHNIEINPWGVADLGFQDFYQIEIMKTQSFFGDLNSFTDRIKDLSAKDHRVVIVSSSSKRLSEIIEGSGLELRGDINLDSKQMLKENTVTILKDTGGLADGISLSTRYLKFSVFSDSEIFGIRKKRRTSKQRSTQRAKLLQELKPGDYVVHVEHGVGKFIGTGNAQTDKSGQEYLILTYAKDDQLFVPMYHIDRVTRYVAPLDRPPSLNRLGTEEWNRTKKRVERATNEMAGELLSLYASRELLGGYVYPDDTPWQIELEDSFPYEETDEQNQAIAHVKADMETNKPMDRLICGDVGYGKTEVALRAAFKAVNAGKQVAILVPTTVLAQQHFVTFTERLKAFPVSVEVLSRFRTGADQKTLVKSLASGAVDICIGTHRLLQKDVFFKDLGLVVIDEEQRFGVAHKERLKEMRTEVDVLTLTATPIPRTLHLSLVGIRDMSMITTPPENRLPIKTYVSEFGDDLIIEAIRRELDRQGQVFFVHNRVHNISYIADYIQKLVPEARIGVAHGQMQEKELEKAMLEFAEGLKDVLVCTTIIESGLDIPNANSMIVNRADTFGLSQLYQLRGRVGRGARRAYSYLLIPPEHNIREISEKRLKTMLEANELGAGFQIAMKDLEIRGAGNVLGSKQSGHIASVGFDLYTKLLEESVETLREQSIRTESLNNIDNFGEEGLVKTNNKDVQYGTSIEIDIPANIPTNYVSDLSSRLDLYRRISIADTASCLTDLLNEMQDRFGTIPLQVANLISLSQLRITASSIGVEKIYRERNKVIIKFHHDIGSSRNILMKILGSKVRIGNNQIHFNVEINQDRLDKYLITMIDKISDFMLGLPVEFKSNS